MASASPPSKALASTVDAERSIEAAAARSMSSRYCCRLSVIAAT
jgi:hypothetical protein